MANLHHPRNIWFLVFLIFVTPMISALAGSDRPKPTKPDEPPEIAELTRIVSRITEKEKQIRATLQQYNPRLETYLQYYKLDSELGDDVTNDDYFLGRLRFSQKLEEKAQEMPLIPESKGGLLHRADKTLKEHVQLDEFAVEPLVLDETSFDREHYIFEPVRWVYLGDLRCLAIDVRPRDPNTIGAFRGRIWVEKQNYAIVRLNGSRTNPPRGMCHIHFDCWRENLQPGEWLPVYIYSQESDLGKHLHYKAETRIWGYDLNPHEQQQKLTTILTDASPPIAEKGQITSDISPVESERQLTVDAEQNILDRLEKARLLAPSGNVDKVLETVINNLIVTNHLESLPPVHCRVMLTSPLESFSLAYTIVLSRGLVDVLPDEASLAMILAHELGHIALGHKLDTRYAFNDRMQVSDEDLLKSLDVSRSPADEAAADTKGIELLKNSPYKEKLAQAGLFLRAATDASSYVPHLFGAHMGGGLTEGNGKTIRMGQLISNAPAFTPRNVEQIAALPLGSRLQVNAWDGSVGFTNRKAVPLVGPSEKMPFRVTPVIPYLHDYAPPAEN
jgi:hypothetical protein